MRASRLVSGLTATALSALVGVAMAPSATADEKDWGVDISGTWRVFSDGEWARTNQVKIEQASVLETWTVDVACVSPIECSGQVTSSLGWTGSARLDGYWYVEHDVPNWMPCPDGTFATGHQMFILSGMDPAIQRAKYRDITTFLGRNVTKSDSGACGVNLSKVIELPARLDKIS
ncbi:hypothetical protein PDG61_22770 [Mycolicibacterium sp. BiH015]|uniref:hypothetical protein n=1 Tax=Mycolicibacterium sp. BiH015 TaxID=3018808 RepID=UPI0022E40890|nr:hypothetical protein [Mycolicibacterium sp. BiH015]MDA2893754.1 hypothetical protein [Mycolicibacterium sp. BiH015]